jgi:hypothetical protein
LVDPRVGAILPAEPVLASSLAVAGGVVPVAAVRAVVAADLPPVPGLEGVLERALVLALFVRPFLAGVGAGRPSTAAKSASANAAIASAAASAPLNGCASTWKVTNRCPAWISTASSPSWTRFQRRILPLARGPSPGTPTRTLRWMSPAGVAAKI